MVNTFERHVFSNCAISCSVLGIILWFLDWKSSILLLYLIYSTRYCICHPYGIEYCKQRCNGRLTKTAVSILYGRYCKLTNFRQIWAECPEALRHNKVQPYSSFKYAWPTTAMHELQRVYTMSSGVRFDWTDLTFVLETASWCLLQVIYTHSILLSLGHEPRTRPT